MSITTIAYKNMMRRKGKTFLVLFGLTLAVATMVSVFMINESIRKAVDEQLDEYGFNIIVTPKTVDLNLDYGGMSLGTISQGRTKYLSEKEAAAVGAAARETERIRSFSPKLLSIGTVGGKRVLLAGVDLATEREVKDWWLIEAGRFPANANELFVGEIAGDKLGLELGDTVTLYDQEFAVAGILMETGSQDDQIIFVDLEKLRSVTGQAGAVSLIDVAAKTGSDVEPLAQELTEALPNASVRSVRQAVSIKENTLEYLIKFGLGVNGIIIIITALIVFTTTASSANERRTEIGVFRAIGFRRRTIMAIFLSEITILGIVAGIIGYFLGLAITGLLPLLAELGVGSAAGVAAQSSAPPVLNPVLMLAAMATAIGIGIPAGLLPARRAANLDPVEALKSL